MLTDNREGDILHPEDYNFQVIDCFHFGAILNSVMLLVGFYDFAPSIS